MKLYVGGAWQGQTELARHENPDAVILTDFHLTIRSKMKKGEDIPAYINSLFNSMPDCVIVCDEIGSGIVPIDPTDRAWREAVGRALCLIAGKADHVTRVVCGIGVRLK